MLFIQENSRRFLGNTKVHNIMVPKFDRASAAMLLSCFRIVHGVLNPYKLKLGATHRHARYDGKDQISNLFVDIVL